jgi:D-alanine-D-alanine ligase
LQRIMVRPYYLYQCDPVKGVEHFRTNVWKGVQIIEMMRGYTGGLCIPTFVVDAPGGGGKIPLQPFYLLSATEHDVLLRNYEGMIINYHNPHELDLERARRQNTNGKEGGTANLIRGNDKALVPEKTPRYRRRSQKKSLLKSKDYLARGLTPEAVAEFDSEETISALEACLSGLGHTVERVGNVFSLVKALGRGERWDLVFNLCEGLWGRSREAQVPALLEAYGLPYTFGDPLTLALTLDKGMAKQIVRDAGLPTPEFLTVSSPSELRDLRVPFAYPVFVKPVAEGTGKGVTPQSLVPDPDALGRQVARLLEQFKQPVLVERYLPGREVTVGILGTGRKARSLGVLEIHLGEKAEPGVYSYSNKQLYEDRVTYALVKDPAVVQEAEALALAAYRAFGCRDAGRVDLRADADGRLKFLEINPLAGIHPVHSDLPILCRLQGIQYADLISGILDSACERLNQVPDLVTQARGV